MLTMWLVRRPRRLKNQTLYKDLAPGVMASGPAIPWTGGWLPRYSQLPSAGSLGFTMKSVDLNVKAGPDHPVRERECGHPAIDGYAHVKPECLEKCARGGGPSRPPRCAAEGLSLFPFLSRLANALTRRPAPR